MQSGIAKRILSRNMERLRAGDYRPQLKRAAKDVRFRFPGSSSWATELQGKENLERWLQRFVHVGLQIFPDEVVAKGPPWRTRLMVRGTIRLKKTSGETVYENRYVIWGRMSWGVLREYEVYEDTEKSTALDEYLVTIGELDPAQVPTGGADMDELYRGKLEGEMEGGASELSVGVQEAGER
jgi:hypothetical protein